MHRPIQAHIDLSALKNNLRVVQRSTSSRVMAVIKANAYGHGLMRVAEALCNADGFALLNVHDAIALRDAEFRQTIRDIVKQKQMDVMLGAVSNMELLIAEGLFEKSGVTPAIRANDTTDIWHPRSGAYAKEPSRPWRTANLAHVAKFCDLGLYSVTFNNILERDIETVSEYRAFRQDAVKHAFRHFLEIFNPNAPQNLLAEAMPFYVNDMIMRVLAGMSKAERPLFLKMPFNGRKAMEELASHDPGLVIGILGGSAGTTRDCFELLSQGEKSGARVALFGRKINLAESPLDLVALVRPVIESEVTAEQAVKHYHAILAKRGLKPKRKLEDDLKITEPALEGYRK